MGQILIVDDDVDVCQLMVRVLRRAGHSADCAFSGAEALRRLETSTPDILLLDVMMPEMSGIDLLRRLRNGRGPKMPVIMFSALNDPQVRKEALALGASDYWVKASLDIHDMISRLNAFLTPAGQ